jgi:hypothetical protein
VVDTIVEGDESGTEGELRLSVLSSAWRGILHRGKGKEGRLVRGNGLCTYIYMISALRYLNEFVYITLCLYMNTMPDV